MLPSIFGENLFEDLFEEPFRMMSAFDACNPLYGKHAKNIMKTDVRETENTYELDIDLPGFKKEDVQVQLENGTLTIAAAKGLDKDEQDEKGRYIRQERYTGQCSRSFYVGDPVKAEDLSAKFEDGILRISMPKAPQRKLPQKNLIAIE
ncbi:MAG: Hsp20/alpha crystallin family protein [Christensenellales bacterium]